MWYQPRKAGIKAFQIGKQIAPRAQPTNNSPIVPVVSDNLSGEKIQRHLLPPSSFSLYVFSLA